MGAVLCIKCYHFLEKPKYHIVLEFIDTPGNLPPSMNITKRLGLKKGLNLTTAYRQCRNGAGLWEILQLEESYSLNNHLSVTQYTAEFQKRLDEFNFTFEDILLTRDGKRDLETFKESGIDRIDFTGFLTEVRQNVWEDPLLKLEQL
uniref:Uncharacterized protein n=1 Tax=Sphaerodactylus townsendi TaxID=933632 RepID=A0ACB8EZ35_9SAUR